MRIRMKVAGLGPRGGEIDVSDELGERLVGSGKADYVSGPALAPRDETEQEDIDYSVDDDHETQEEED